MSGDQQTFAESGWSDREQESSELEKIVGLTPVVSESGEVACKGTATERAVKADVSAGKVTADRGVAESVRGDDNVLLLKAVIFLC